MVAFGSGASSSGGAALHTSSTTTHLVVGSQRVVDVIVEGDGGGGLRAGGSSTCYRTHQSHAPRRYVQRCAQYRVPAPRCLNTAQPSAANVFPHGQARSHAPRSLPRAAAAACPPTGPLPLPQSCQARGLHIEGPTWMHRLVDGLWQRRPSKQGLGLHRGTAACRTPPAPHRLSSSSLPPYCARTRSNRGRFSSLATCEWWLGEV